MNKYEWKELLFVNVPQGMSRKKRLQQMTDFYNEYQKNMNYYHLKLQTVSYNGKSYYEVDFQNRLEKERVHILYELIFVNLPEGPVDEELFKEFHRQYTSNPSYFQSVLKRITVKEAPLYEVDYKQWVKGLTAKQVYKELLFVNVPAGKKYEALCKREMKSFYYWFTKNRSILIKTLKQVAYQGELYFEIDFKNRQAVLDQTKTERKSAAKDTIIGHLFFDGSPTQYKREIASYLKAYTARMDSIAGESSLIQMKQIRDRRYYHILAETKQEMEEELTKLGYQTATTPKTEASLEPLRVSQDRTVPYEISAETSQASGQQLDFLRQPLGSMKPRKTIDRLHLPIVEL